jgi:hypothetical protein
MFAGTVLRLKGSIVNMTILDGAGVLLPTVATAWRDASKTDDKTQEKRITRKCVVN